MWARVMMSPGRLSPFDPHGRAVGAFLSFDGAIPSLRGHVGARRLHGRTKWNRSPKKRIHF